MIADDLRELLGHRLPVDHARQTVARDMAAKVLGAVPAAAVLDLGCGAGDSVDLFRSLDPSTTWVGLDVHDSAEVLGRTRDDARFATFDGERIPFGDESFDVVYCAQVLEHVPRPEPLLADVARVLKPRGMFVGSTSQLEPFHSRSTFGYSPYGLSLLLERSGLEVSELRPSIDALTLIVRRGLGGPRFFDRWWPRESPLNRAIDLFARTRRLDPAATNAVKLLFCGQLTFVARRSQSPQPSITTPA